MEGEQNLRRTATLGALASVAIVIGIIVVVWLVFFRNTSDNKTEQAKGDSNSSQTSNNGNQSGSGNSSDNSAESQSNGSTSGSQSGSSSSSTDKNGKNLANTGPKENAMVFLGVTAAATGVYYIRTRRKLANQ